MAKGKTLENNVFAMILLQNTGSNVHAWYGRASMRFECSLKGSFGANFLTWDTLYTAKGKTQEKNVFAMILLQK